MPKPYTAISFRSGTSCLEIELAQTLTPEAFETVPARTLVILTDADDE